MPSLGMQEIIVIFILALIIFGPRKLPEIGKTIGKGLNEFKKASNDLKRAWEDEVDLEKEKETMKGIFKDTTDALTQPVTDFSRELKESTDAFNEPVADVSREIQEPTDGYTEPVTRFSSELEESTESLAEPVADVSKDIKESTDISTESAADNSKEIQ
jgi:sec-independent protein translocase protein TatA